MAQSQDIVDGVCYWSEMCMTVNSDWCEKNSGKVEKGEVDRLQGLFFYI